MYVCICKALTERDVHAAVANGCSTVRELKCQIGLAGDCGRCASCAKGMLKACQPANAGTSNYSPALATA